MNADSTLSKQVLPIATTHSPFWQHDRSFKAPGRGGMAQVDVKKGGGWLWANSAGRPKKLSLRADSRQEPLRIRTARYGKLPESRSIPLGSFSNIVLEAVPAPLPTRSGCCRHRVCLLLATSGGHAREYRSTKLVTCGRRDRHRCIHPPLRPRRLSLPKLNYPADEGYWPLDGSFDQHIWIGVDSRVARLGSSTLT